MPVSHGSPTPVIPEVCPSNAQSYHPHDKHIDISPPSSPKAVRFATPSSGLVQSTRPPTNAEAWSAWRFEEHACRCRQCHDPIAVHRRGDRLCEEGRSLAHDAAMHFYHQSGEVYSIHNDEDGQRIRVELHPEYTQVRALLKSLAHARRPSRTVPIISYDDPVRPPSTSTSTHRPSTSYSTSHYVDERRAAIVEPSSSDRNRRTSSSTQTTTSTKPRQRGTRYRTVVLQEDVVGDLAAAAAARRGSLYERDSKREHHDKGYRVEIREPTRQSAHEEDDNTQDTEHHRRRRHRHREHQVRL